MALDKVEVGSIAEETVLSPQSVGPPAHHGVGAGDEVSEVVAVGFLALQEVAAGHVERLHVEDLVLPAMRVTLKLHAGDRDGLRLLVLRIRVIVVA